MTLNRIQKLLFSEYSDFEDMVLVESPFAETTRDGRGIRQVQIGLTPTKLVLATDIIKKATDYPITFFPGCIDAEIECLELISIFPIELVSLSVFRRRRRKVLKAKFHDGNPNHNCKVVYFELGGSDKRKMFWNLWCERVKFLSPEDKGNSSLTETSVASSTSISSLHVAKTRISNDKIWQYYSGEKDILEKNNLRWTDRDLFFGDKHEITDFKFEPMSYASILQSDADEIRTLYRRQGFPISVSSAVSSIESKEAVDSNKKGEHINRFGEGIDERCKTGLYLPAISYSTVGGQEVSSCVEGPKIKTTSSSFKRMCEEGVEIWERVKKIKSDRHPRRYGFAASSDLDYCFGEYFLGRGETFSLQYRARLISRFINSAEKCHLLHNYQSCRSLLNGLQSPAVYRLRKTWCHVRHHHATKYQMFEKLCRLYKDPRLFCYQKSFYKSSHGQPYLPSAVHLLAILLGKVFDKPVSSSWSSSTLSQCSNIADRKKISIVERCRAAHHKNSMPKILKQIFSALKIYPNEKNGIQSDGDKSSVSSLNDKTVEVTSFFETNEVVKCFRNGFEDATELFVSAQKAATKYDLGENHLAREFLLKVPYKEHKCNYFSSLRMEPD